MKDESGPDINKILAPNALLAPASLNGKTPPSSDQHATGQAGKHIKPKSKSRFGTLMLVAVGIVLVGGWAIQTSRATEKPKATEVEGKVLDQKLINQVVDADKEVYALIGAKYDVPSQAVLEITRDYDKKHGWMTNKPSSDFDVTMDTLSRQHNLPKKIVANVLMDYRVLQILRK